ncbi:MAG TPA: retropepsin-like aspartic protease [Bacteroidia bacterium]|nr:retropepsin-like aspartic protease [Bacteroidia bacterium]
MKKSVLPISIRNIDRQGYHLFIKGHINKKTLNLVLDTGASQTVFDHGRMAELLGRSDFDSLDGVSTGIGNEKLLSHAVEVPKLQIGDLLIRKKMIVLLNLDHINAFYQSIGYPHIDGIIGCDLLKKYKAVVDIGKKTLTLYIRPGKKKK